MVYPTPSPCPVENNLGLPRGKHQAFVLDMYNANIGVEYKNALGSVLGNTGKHVVAMESPLFKRQLADMASDVWAHDLASKCTIGCACKPSFKTILQQPE
jgi:hypothetical protein